MEATRCICHLQDCHYWHPVPGEPAPSCDCTHNEKPFYMVQPCPLYRKEWKGKEGELENLKDKFLKKRRH